MGIKIISTGKGLPEHILTNDHLSEFLDTSDEWISSRTGIRARPVAKTESLSDLALVAANEALERAGISAGELDLIICSTVRGDFVLPSLACAVAEKLGTFCPAFDINAACSGFIYALSVAEGFVASGRAKKILVICAEMMSRLVDWTDRSSCVLFGDGAAACVVLPGDSLKYLKITAQGNTHTLVMPADNGNSPFLPQFGGGFLKMQGQEVFRFAVSQIGEQIDAALAALGLEAGDIDLFLLHQANKRIIDSARTRLGLPEEKFPTNIENCGNISSVSLPLLLDEMLCAGKIKTGDRLLLSAFGAGLTTGTAVLVW